MFSKSGRFSYLMFTSEVSRPSQNIWYADGCYADAALGEIVSLTYAI